MAQPRSPEDALFVVGLLGADMAALECASDALTQEWGPALLASVPLPFTFTKYYEKELGSAPFRAFLVFPGIYEQDTLASRKLRTNDIERNLAEKIDGDFSRPVNIDPGYLTLSKLVLASAKDFSHRIYLKQGIYAEITLQYYHKSFHTLPWTFPDYASGCYFPFFLEARDQLQKLRKPSSGI